LGMYSAKLAVMEWSPFMVMFVEAAYHPRNQDYPKQQ
jgi:hypothetical protein